jgi:hypothetical protein
MVKNISTALSAIARHFKRKEVELADGRTKQDKLLPINPKIVFVKFINCSRIAVSRSIRSYSNFTKHNIIVVDI